MMADPVSATLASVGSAAAILQILGTSIKLTKQTWECFGRVQEAPEEAQSFLNESSAFHAAVNIFHDLAQELPDDLSRKDRKTREKLAKYVLEMCRSAKKASEELKGRIAKLTWDKSLPWDRLRSKIQWIFQENRVKALRLRQERATSYIRIYLLAIMIQNWKRHGGQDPNKL